MHAEVILLSIGIDLSFHIERMPDDIRNSFLAMTLELAVPLSIERLKREPWDNIVVRLPKLAQFIAEHGDNILFRSPKHGETAEAFTKLSEAIAALSFVPGGVKALGTHWQSRHPDHETGDSAER